MKIEVFLQLKSIIESETVILECDTKVKLPLLVSMPNQKWADQKVVSEHFVLFSETWFSLMVSGSAAEQRVYLLISECIVLLI